MKTAVSVPDDLFAQVDRLARRAHRSRTEVHSAARREYVARHAPHEVTAGLDAVLVDVGLPSADPLVSAAAGRTLEHRVVIAHRARCGGPSWPNPQAPSPGSDAPWWRCTLTPSTRAACGREALTERVGRLSASNRELLLAGIGTLLGRS